MRIPKDVPNQKTECKTPLFFFCLLYQSSFLILRSITEKYTLHFDLLSVPLKKEKKGVLDPRNFEFNGKGEVAGGQNDAESDSFSLLCLLLGTQV